MNAATRVLAAAIAAKDIRVTMPPYPYLFEGLDAIQPLLERAFGEDRDGDWRLFPPRRIGCQRQPATCDVPTTEVRAFKLDVLRIEDGAVVEITTFGPGLFPAFGLPLTL